MCRLSVPLNLRMPFINCDSIDVTASSCSAQQKNLGNFGRGQYEQHVCEIILNEDQCFRRRCHLNYVLSIDLMVNVQWGRSV